MSFFGKSKKSDLVTGAYFTAQFMSNLSQAALNAGLEFADLYDLGNDEKSQPHIAALIESIKKAKVVNLDSDLDVSVNYAETLEVKVTRLNKLGMTYVNESLTSKNFPVPEGRSGTMKMRLVLPKLKQVMSTDKVKQFVGECKLEIGDPYQLLDFVEQNWDRLQPVMTGGLWIVALCTSWRSPDGHHYVVCLDCSGSYRSLCLYWERDWSDRWRTLGSRSVPSNT